MYEWDWVALSYYITPCQLQKLTQNLGEEKQFFQRCARMVWSNIFLKVFHCPFRGRDLLNFLQTNGYIPGQKAHILTNDTYGFINEKGRWEELDQIPNLTLMRHFWTTYLSSAQVEQLTDFVVERGLNQTLVPCSSCKLTIPLVDMETDQVCSFCWQVQKCSRACKKPAP